jgi:hypothetical protein
MPWYVDKQLVPDALISQKAEERQIWTTAVHTAQNDVLIAQEAARDPRPVVDDEPVLFAFVDAVGARDGFHRVHEAVRWNGGRVRRRRYNRVRNLSKLSAGWTRCCGIDSHRAGE